MDKQDLFIVSEYIKEFLSSDARKEMLDGEAYYTNKIKGVAIPHAFMTNMVDEKTQYLLGKEPTLKSDGDNDVYVDKVREVLGDDFSYNLQLLADEASNKGIAFAQVYFNENGEFKTFLHKSEQIVPVWSDNAHNALQWLIRIYEVDEYVNEKKKKLTKVEVYDDTCTYYYLYENGQLIEDSEKYLVLGDGQEFGHYTVDGVQYSFGRVPFIWCKNNAYEFNDLRLVKQLIDAYNNNRLNLDKLLDDYKNFLVAIRGYAGDTDNIESLEDMLKKRRIFLDGDGGLDIMTPSIDTQANDTHNSTLKDDIILFGRSVDRNKMSNGQAPSGVALKTLYAGLDLKCNKLESEIKNYYNHLLWFVNVYLSLKGVSVPANVKSEIILNRDITMNESEAVEQCNASMGVLSHKTVLVNHPFVVDVDEELKQIEEEKKLMNNFDGMAGIPPNAFTE